MVLQFGGGSRECSHNLPQFTEKKIDIGSNLKQINQLTLCPT